MARVSTVSERRAEAGERRPSVGASRSALFDVLCDVLDRVQTLPEDTREQFADEMQRAMRLGYTS